MKLLILIWTILLIGCGNGFSPLQPPVIDSEFQPYVEMYLVEKKARTGDSGIKTIDMEFFSLEGAVIGRCWFSVRRRIQVDPVFWFLATDDERYVVILHELGHCDLNRNHTDQESIMEEYNIGSRFSANKEYFLDELFNP